jgi:hypothetical protein
VLGLTQVEPGDCFEDTGEDRDAEHNSSAHDFGVAECCADPRARRACDEDSLGNHWTQVIAIERAFDRGRHRSEQPTTTGV